MQIFLGWVATLIVAGVTAGLVTAVLVYSPNKLMSDDRVYANAALNRESQEMINLAGGPTGPLGVRLAFPREKSNVCALLPACLCSVHKHLFALGKQSYLPCSVNIYTQWQTHSGKLSTMMHST